MMKEYRFVGLGTESFIGAMQMNRFGARFRIEEELAEMAQRGGTPLVVEEQFASHGFTDNDLKIWASPFVSQHDVPGNTGDAEDKADFLAKVYKVQQHYAELRQSLLAPHERSLPDVPVASSVPLIAASDNQE